MIYNYMDKFEEWLAKRGLSFDRLRNFCRVAENQGITRAAGGDPGRQSLYSRQIRELEEFFGVELIRRRGKGIALTPAGARLAQIVRLDLAALGDFHRECASEPVRLTITAGNSVIEWGLMPRMPDLLQAFPRAHITLLDQRTQDAVAVLHDHRADLAVVRQSGIDRRLRQRPFLTIEYALFVPTALCGGRKDSELLKQLDRLPVATLLGGSFREYLDQAQLRARLPLRIVLQCSSFTQAAQALSTGRVAAVLPTIAARALPAGSWRKLTLPFLEKYRRPLVVAWHPRLAEVRPVIIKAAECLAAKT